MVFQETLFLYRWIWVFCHIRNENDYPMCCCYQEQTLTDGLPLGRDSAGDLTWPTCSDQASLRGPEMSCLSNCPCRSLHLKRRKRIQIRMYICTCTHTQLYRPTHIINSPTYTLILVNNEMAKFNCCVCIELLLCLCQELQWIRPFFETKDHHVLWGIRSANP